MSFSICPENCEYRAEGNAGIVIRLIKEGTVLRLKKQDNLSKLKIWSTVISRACCFFRSSLGSIILMHPKNVKQYVLKKIDNILIQKDTPYTHRLKASPSASDVFTELESQIKIIRNTLKPILGESFVNDPLIVFLRSEEIKTLNEAVAIFRPAHRKHKSVKEEDTYVYMLPDYCSLPQSLKLMPTYGPVLSIEIKLKQGFMKEEYLPSSFSSLPLPMCRFCLMQRYKLKRGVISSKSGYCPTDLFSGCYSRMLHALKMLCKTPQNNFRIFKNQRLIYSEEKKEDLNELLSDFVPSERTKGTDLLCDLILQALVKPFPYGMQESPVSLQKKFSQNCINAHTVCSENDLCHELPLNCVLERVLSSQLLDDLNIADLYQLYLQVKGSTDKCSDFIGCYSRSEIPPYIGELRKASDESDYQYASRKVWEFLVALTMKDCSLMITLKHLILNSSNTTHMQNVISDKYGNLYVFSIAIADLDAKPLNKVEKVYSDVSFMLECDV